MVVKVTQEHINKGKPYNFAECPVALACRKKLGKIAVGSATVRRLGKGPSHIWSLPLSAIAFIHNFDGGEAVLPFSFELEEVNR